MSNYQAPVGEYQFLASHLLAKEFQACASEEGSAQMLGTVLENLGRFVSERLLPLTDIADRQGCRVTAEGVKTPPGYRAAYEDFVADGWGALHTAVEDGGQGLGWPFGFACDELLSSGSMAFALYVSIRLGVYSVIKSIGCDYLRQTYLEKIGSGEWNASMCLTEPQSGTDLSLIRTTARVNEDGTYQLSGNKIFISGGDHDLTDNIVHLVLARIQGAAAGLSGLGLFIVPKFKAAADGRWSQANGVTCPRIEEKLGIHASATAELLFAGAQGWLVGQPGEGLPGMFAMMKLARIGTAFQAIGVAERAVQQATAYALERVQGRDLCGGRKGALPIAEHPNIRREIVRMRMLTASARMLAFTTTLTYEHSQNREDREASQRARLLLPVLMSTAKAICSEIGVDVTSAAMQTHGGHGYIRDTGIEVLLRDVQILPIYEGTNDVQSLDLVVRRLDDGRQQSVDGTLQWLRGQIAELPAVGEHRAHVPAVEALLGQIADVVQQLQNELKTTPFAALQCAREFLWLVGHGVIATLWLRVLAALDQPGLPIDPAAKRAEAQFYFAYQLPDAGLRVARLKASGAIQAALQSYPLHSR